MVTPDRGPRAKPKVSESENLTASCVEAFGPSFCQFLISGFLSRPTGNVMTFCSAYRGWYIAKMPLLGVSPITAAYRVRLAAWENRLRGIQGNSRRRLVASWR